MTATVLCVDDDRNVLDGLGRTLHGRYALVPCNGPDEALALVTADPDRFAVVLSDLRMPGTDGITLLSAIREIAPTAVRVLLTGFADLDSSMEAINRGQIFRFLTKPATRDDLITALDAAADQNRLILAEKELLEQTLRGSMQALLDTLSLANPTAFARANRVKRMVNDLAAAVSVGDWTIEVAAMLSQIGTVTIAPEIIRKLGAGVALTDDERTIVRRIPQVTEQLLADIPRLEPVREIIRFQNDSFDGGHGSNLGVKGTDLPLGSRMLKLALDIETLEARGLGRDEIAVTLTQRAGRYDPDLLAVMVRLTAAVVPGTVQMVEVGSLSTGMQLEDDVLDDEGKLLLARGHEITENLIGVLVKLHLRGRIDGYVAVRG